MTPDQWADEIMKWGFEGEPSHVIEIVRQALAEEREACAKLAEGHVKTASGMLPHTVSVFQAACQEIAAAIRARQ
jgi:hypothetical protein